MYFGTFQEETLGNYKFDLYVILMFKGKKYPQFL